MLNVSLLLKELRHVTIHPEQWDQGVWAKATQEEKPDPRPSACGSYGCLAGNTVIHSGERLYWEKEGTIFQDGAEVPLWIAAFVQTAEGHRGESVSYTAQALFGMTRHQAMRMFAGENTLDQLWEIAGEIAGGEISNYEYNEAKRAAARVKKQAVLKEAQDNLEKLRKELYPASDPINTNSWMF